jgi:protein gp37
MSTTTIEWTATRLPDGTVLKGKSFNPWQGCHKVSAACKNCYAEQNANRFNPGHWGLLAPRKMQSEKYWQQPHVWNRYALKKGIRLKVFCNSMSDLFERHVNPDINELLNEQRSRLFNLTKETPYLDYLFLTKRIDNVLSMVPSDWLTDWPVNVWQGTTIENKQELEIRMPELLKVPAQIRFVSMEPLLEAVDMSNYLKRKEHWPYTTGIDWVIAGGDSGDYPRPSHPDWFRSLRDQCEESGVPFFFKQWGELLPHCQAAEDQKAYPKEYPSPHNPNKKNIYYRVGKTRAGRLLDGREHNDMPTSITQL